MTPKCSLLCFFCTFFTFNSYRRLANSCIFQWIFYFSIPIHYVTKQYVIVCLHCIPRCTSNQPVSLINKNKHGVWLKQLIGKVKKTLLVFIKDSDCLLNSSIPLFKPVWNTSEKQGRIVIIVLTLWYVPKKIFKIIQYPHVIYISNHQMYNFRRRVWQ